MEHYLRSYTLLDTEPHMQHSIEEEGTFIEFSIVNAQPHIPLCSAVNNPSLDASKMPELNKNGNKEKTRQGSPVVGQRPYMCSYMQFVTNFTRI